MNAAALQLFLTACETAAGDVLEIAKLKGNIEGVLFMVLTGVSECDGTEAQDRDCEKSGELHGVGVLIDRRKVD